MSLQVKTSTFFVLDFGFDIFNSVRGLHLKGDGFTRQSFDKNLHRCSLKRKREVCQSDWTSQHGHHNERQLKQQHALKTCSCDLLRHIKS